MHEATNSQRRSQKVFLSVRTGFVTATLTNVLNNTSLYKSQGGERLSDEPRLVLRRNPPVKLTPPSLGCRTDGIFRTISKQPATSVITTIENAFQSKFFLRYLAHRLSQGVLCFQNVTQLEGTSENATLLTTIRNVAIFTNSRIPIKHYVYRSTNVESTDINSFTAVSAVGVRSGAAAWGTALQTGRSRVPFPMVSLEFFIDIILPATLCPWVWLSL